MADHTHPITPPLSLAEQAWAHFEIVSALALNEFGGCAFKTRHEKMVPVETMVSTVESALERLKELEQQENNDN